MSKVITLLTGNQGKKRYLEIAAKDLDVEIKVENPWLPEIQDIDTAKVASFAACYGADLLNKPVIKMDAGFYIEELKGFPGPLIHSVYEQIGIERFFEIIKNLKNRNARIENSLAYCEPHGKPVVFTDGCKGVVVSKLVPINNETFIGRLFIPYHNKNKELKTIGQIRQENLDLSLEIWGNAGQQFIKWFVNK